MKRIALLLIALSRFSQLSSGEAPATSEPANGVHATKLEIKEDETPARGRLYLTVDGKERKIADDVARAWLIDGGRAAVYSRRQDGAGGFENDGESLRIYTLGTGKTEKILSEFVGIDAVMDVKLSNGEIALLIRMGDSASFVPYFAVVNPKRGEVLYRAAAELTEIKGDQITLAFYREEDWDTIEEERGGSEFEPDKVILPTPKIKPARTETHDLKEVLRRKVIFNKPTNVSEDE